MEENTCGRGLLGVTSGELLSMNLLRDFKAVEVFFSERDKVLLEGGSAEEGSAMVSESYGGCVPASQERGPDADANHDEFQYNWDTGQLQFKAKGVCVPGVAFAKSAGLVCDAVQSPVVGGIAAPSAPQPPQKIACLDSISPMKRRKIMCSVPGVLGMVSPKPQSPISSSSMTEAPSKGFATATPMQHIFDGAQRHRCVDDLGLAGFSP